MFFRMNTKLTDEQLDALANILNWHLKAQAQILEQVKGGDTKLPLADRELTAGLLKQCMPAHAGLMTLAEGNPIVRSASFEEMNSNFGRLKQAAKGLIPGVSG